MDPAGKVILTIYAIIGLLVIVALIYLIDKRLKDKKKETFEKRDN